MKGSSVLLNCFRVSEIYKGGSTFQQQKSSSSSAALSGTLESFSLTPPPKPEFQTQHTLLHADMWIL